MPVQGVKQISFENVKQCVDDFISNGINSTFKVPCFDGAIRNLNLYKLSEDFLWEKIRTCEYETSAIGTYYEIYKIKDYERAGVKIQRGDVVVDVGANVGVFERWAYQNGAEKIYSFEPEMKNFKCLLENKSQKCIAHNVAVSGKKGLVTLFLDKSDGGHSLINNNINNTKTKNTQQIQSLTLNNIFDLVPKIDFLKVDVEGAELEIFEAANEEKLSKIRNIVVEYHNMAFNFDDSKREIFIKKFTDLGFKFFLYFVDSINHLQLIYFWK